MRDVPSQMLQQTTLLLAPQFRDSQFTSGLSYITLFSTGIIFNSFKMKAMYVFSLEKVPSFCSPLLQFVLEREIAQ
jgi:hypothetical protein